MAELIGYARVSTNEQDASAQRAALEERGAGRVYVDQGFTGRNTQRPALAQALAAVRDGDTLIVTKLDRLARSVKDAHTIVDELTKRGVTLQIDRSPHDPRDPTGRLLLTVLSMVAEFEADLISARTREGLAIAKAKGRLKGKPPKLTSTQEAHLVALHDARQHTVSEIAAIFGVGRATVYRALQRAGRPLRTNLSYP